MLSYLGVFFVVRPAMLFPVDALDLSKETNTTAVICALGAAITQATAYISMRKLHDLNYMTISLFFSLFGVGFSILMLLIFKVVRTFLIIHFNNVDMFHFSHPPFLLRFLSNLRCVLELVSHVSDSYSSRMDSRLKKLVLHRSCGTSTLCLFSFWTLRS